MLTLNRFSGRAALVLLTACAWSPRASAHISLDQADTHKSRYGDANIKDAPCGTAGGTRGTNVYTYKPGETITVSIIEFVPHPGYFRIAFDDDGDDDFVDPVSIKPVDPSRTCPFNEFDQCGTTNDFQDFYNTPAVLPGMDNLDPHVTAPFGQKYTWEVTLPNVECDNCTLQIIQVMEDVIHGAYNTDRAIEPSYIEDNYHQCIDLVLDDGIAGNADAGAAGAPGAGGASGGAGAPGDGGSTGSSRGNDDGGCSFTVGSPSRGASMGVALVTLAVGLASKRRRTRSESRA